jgi:hypothetical protein
MVYQSFLRHFAALVGKAIPRPGVILILKASITTSTISTRCTDRCTIQYDTVHILLLGRHL